VAELTKSYPAILKQILVIDFNLENLKKIERDGLKGLFGDVASTNTLEHAHIKDAKLILSTIPDMLLKGVTNMELVKTCRFLSSGAYILATADSTEHALKLKEAGASEVIVPYQLTGETIAAFVQLKCKA
jgi:voltage-gated potassium channel Kch